MRLLLVDDDAELRSTVRNLLGQHPDLTIVGEAADAAEVFPIIGPLRPEVVLKDRTLPRRNGIDATRQPKTMWADVAVVVLTVHADPEYIQDAGRRRARGAGEEDARHGALADAAPRHGAWGLDGPSRSVLLLLTTGFPE